MVNQINRTAARDIDKISPTDAARNYNEKDTSNRLADTIFADEVIAFLANAHENRRARQVTEWERMGGRQVHHTA